MKAFYALIALVSLVVGFSRPVRNQQLYVSVKDYGAKGDSKTDDTAAIEAAIRAACSIGASPAGKPAVFFPLGDYVVAQPQSGTNAIFHICDRLELLGAEGLNGYAQFQQPPQGAQITAWPGATPNRAAIFSVIGSSSNQTNQPGITFKNLYLAGFNEAVFIQGTAGVWFDNCTLTSQHTGMPDNTPLKITNTLWVTMIGGGLQSGGPTDPTLILTGEAGTHSEDTSVDFIDFENIITHGGGFLYQQRVQTQGPIASDFTFKNIVQEQSGQPFLSLTSNGNAWISFAHITFDHVNQADSPDSSNPLLVLDAPGSYLDGVVLANSYSPLSTGIVVQTGYLRSVTSLESTGNPRDANGNPTGMSFVAGSPVDNGSDFIGWSGVACTDYMAEGCNGAPPATRWFSAGNSTSTPAADPSFGLLFGDGATHGYGTAIKESAAGNLDFMVASFLPPTGLIGAQTTGGTLAAGTYYAVIWSTAGSAGPWGCPLPGLNSTWTYAAPVKLASPNNAITYRWKLPGAMRGARTGFCLAPQTTPFTSTGSANEAIFVPGANTTSFTYTGQSLWPIGYVWPQSPMTAVHRMTYNAFGVNTTNPRDGANLDVAGVEATVPGTFSALPPCSSATEGFKRAVKDSKVKTWGSAMAGGGSFHVEAYCDGTAWTVSSQ